MLRGRKPTGAATAMMLTQSGRSANLSRPWLLLLPASAVPKQVIGRFRQEVLEVEGGSGRNPARPPGSTMQNRATLHYLLPDGPLPPQTTAPALRRSVQHRPRAGVSGSVSSAPSQVPREPRISTLCPSPLRGALLVDAGAGIRYLQPCTSPPLDTHTSLVTLCPVEPAPMVISEHPPAERARNNVYAGRGIGTRDPFLGSVWEVKPRP